MTNDGNHMESHTSNACTRRLILSIVLALIALSFKIKAEQVLPADLPTMPVLIEIPLPTPNGLATFGSGIYLEESNKLFLVTAAHCIFNIHSTNRFELINSNASCFSRDRRNDLKVILAIDLKKLLSNGRITRHQSHDVAVINLGFFTNPTINSTVSCSYCEGVSTLTDYSVRATSFPVNDTCVTFTNVNDGSDTYIFGYPAELLNTGVASEIDYSHPLIRKGIISQHNTYTSKLIIDSGVYGGNSGGPVLCVEHTNIVATAHTNIEVTAFKLVGIVTQFVPYLTRIDVQDNFTNSVLVNSGYSVAEPIDFAIELMRQIEVKYP